VVRVVIVGGGIAGVSAAETIRNNSEKAAITLISSEKELPYYRLNLTRYLAGEIAADDLLMHPADWYQQQRIELVTGKSVESISPEKHAVELDSGESLFYDQLILTAGSHPFIPPIPGSNLAGVFTLRTASDADLIIDQVKPGETCVCIGGGILGLETAGALSRRGADVVLLESHEWLMPRQLNQAAASRLEAHMADLGITLVKSAQTARLLQEQGSVSGVELVTGERIECRAVIYCTGVRSNTVLARKAGLEVNNGVVVDSQLRTSLPGIYAAGDIAEYNGVVYGIWGPAQYQGSIAGLNAIGETTLFGGVPRSNALKVLGIEMLSIGEFTPPDGSYQVIWDESEAGFAHFVFHDGKMTGAILLDNIEPAAKIKKAIEEKKDFSGLLCTSPDCTAILEAL
jgi:nitrite reductase (NADH) large subunit